jgi:hypothetical protein
MRNLLYISAVQYNSMGHFIDYPLASWMKNVKMYPVYETFIKNKIR